MILTGMVKMHVRSKIAHLHNTSQNREHIGLFQSLKAYCPEKVIVLPR